MSPASGLSIWGLILHADFVVKFILLVLLALSVTTWCIVFERYKAFKQAKVLFMDFYSQFWAGKDLQVLYQHLCRSQQPLTGGAAIFFAGIQELARRQSEAKHPQRLLDGANGMMKVSLIKEADKLESGLNILATIGSVSPYIGLFGTVWGIMSSFQALGMVEQATLQMVAPGISEALVATAMGLFVAIPAVIAYNRFASSADFLINQYENFKDEYASLLHRQLYANNN